jgi:alpha-L-fucosidase
MRSTAFLLLRLLCFTATTTTTMILAWEPTWESLDSRPNPGWYDEAKFGIFIHWGVFSVPAFHSEWFWRQWADNRTELDEFVRATENSRFAYQDYAQRFDATLYHPDQWAKLFADSGAQYVVLTSKHHEGFCNWDSRDVPSTWGWNAMEVGPRRDILGDLANAIKATLSSTTGKKLHWGVYHSLYEWFNLAYLSDKANGWNTTTFRDSKTIPELYDLVKKYEPELIWSDGDWEAPDSYWRAAEFLAWYATNSSVAETAVWNDRWGGGLNGKHGSFITPSDRYNPGKLEKRKWENALTVDRMSWGFNRNSSIGDYLSVEQLVHELIEVVAWGGNMLLNIGPSADGTISPIFGDRLLGIGAWLQVNGESIYGTRPWDVAQNETATSTYYTRKNETLYVLVTAWPRENILRLEAPQVTPESKVRMLGLAGLDSHLGSDLVFSASSGGADGTRGLSIQVPALTPDIIPCQHAWVFAITGVANLQSADDAISSL